MAYVLSCYFMLQFITMLSFCLCTSLPTSNAYIMLRRLFLDFLENLIYCITSEPRLGSNIFPFSSLEKSYSKD